MNDTTYNGWTNWATWNVSLWIDNDYGMYSDRMDSDIQKEGSWTEYSAQGFCEVYFPNGTPDMWPDNCRECDHEFPSPDSQYCDACAKPRADRGYDMAAVNWQEIAEAWNAEAED